MYTKLSEKLGIYSSEVSNQSVKEQLKLLSTAVVDSSFIELQSTNNKNILADINSNLHNRDVDYEGFSNRHPYNEFNNIINQLYFQYLAYLNDKRKNISYFEKLTKELETQISVAQTNINTINETAKLISGASILSEYAKDFDKSRKEQKNSAKNWLIILIVSILVFILLIALLLFFQISTPEALKMLIADDVKIDQYFSLLAITIKGAIILGWLQVIGFFKRNYFAHKHLEQGYAHRRDILKTLHAVYNTLSDNVEKDKIISIGAAIAFQENESGFITTKEGAGGDDIANSLLNRLIK